MRKRKRWGEVQMERREKRHGVEEREEGERVARKGVGNDS